MDAVNIPEAEFADLLDHPEREVSQETISEVSRLPLKHFRLSTHPFADSVNPNFFFRTEAHEEAFLAMKQCIEDNVALGLTTAISGTGKTLLTQVLLKELEGGRFHCILVLAYPGMTRSALLREVIGELGIDYAPPRATAHKLISIIQQHIINQYLRGVRVVLIIDEVHFLQADALHILRTLSNIEVPEQKLVTILLFGEQTFLKRLSHPTYRSIFSRMFARTELRPLRCDEMVQYVKFRLLVAGGDPNLFSADSVAPLFERSHGIPREINRICHNSLAIAAREQARQVSGAIVERVPAAPGPSP